LRLARIGATVGAIGTSFDGENGMSGNGGAPTRWQDDLYDLLRRNNITSSPMCRMPATAS
jgi:hypothetical protein